jgi:hypothetical protein
MRLPSIVSSAARQKRQHEAHASRDGKSADRLLAHGIGQLRLVIMCLLADILDCGFAADLEVFNAREATRLAES